ncbi:hypothetical protein Pyn_03082 [Prunus yedoensis var. nudiflora]|uniref:Uncharacterized protein n=1 Tax=Prunus yedoensis var. nudiflora TaxID=2094558 RepID=A0A314YRD7_PRUYE|nr:hypothetical protein Pyn_03082 [Prunus yedoensis var. nudiflora]
MLPRLSHPSALTAFRHVSYRINPGTYATPVLELPSSLQFSKRDHNLYTTRLSSQSEASTSHSPATTSSAGCFVLISSRVSRSLGFRSAASLSNETSNSGESI